MAGGITNYLPVTVVRTSPPFKITASKNEDAEDKYYIEPGVCFSTFSFRTGTFVPIEGMGTGQIYTLGKEDKFFIEIDVLPNLQVSEARIKCETVGNDNSWKNYPDMIEIKPVDETDEDGKVTKLIDGKVQTKCYVLIGYRSDSSNKNGEIQEPETNQKTPIQILDTNFILLASVVSGVPVIFPAPYFNGQLHVNAINENFN
jgi:hypothetical protein